MALPSTHSIGHRTAVGFAWLFGQSIGEKVLQVAGQVALAWILRPDDFQLVALVYTVTTFAGLLQAAGLREVLMQRHRHFDRWAGATFWLSLAIGLGAGLVTAAAAAPAASFYRRPEIQALLLTAALLLPINALATVPEARLRSQMRFRVLAAAGLAATLLTLAASIAMALAGFGPYSFLVPPIAVGALRAAALWAAAPVPVGWRPRLHRWPFLFGSSLPLLVASLALMVTYQGSTVILGRMYPGLPEAAVFYFAWSLSDQSMRLLVNNLSGVLFPALNTLAGNPGRQMDAFLRATRSLLAVGTPICLAQAALAAPLIRLVFEPKWEPAIPVMAAISVGMTARLVFGPTESMLLTQRRQRDYMRLAVAYAAVFVAAVLAGAARAGATGAAVAAAACLILLAAVSLRVAVAPAGQGWRAVLRLGALPVLAGLAAFGPAAAVAALFPPTVMGDLAAVLVVGPLGLAAYAAIILRLDPPLCRDLAARLRRLLRPATAPAPPPEEPPPLPRAAGRPDPSRSPTPAALR